MKRAHRGESSAAGKRAKRQKEKDRAKREEEENDGRRVSFELKIDRSSETVGVMVTSSEKNVNGWIGKAVGSFKKKRQRRLIVGINFHRGNTGAVATIEVAVSTTLALIFQVSRNPLIPDSLLRFFKHESNKFVSFGNKKTTENAFKEVGIEIDCVGVMDLVEKHSWKKARANRRTWKKVAALDIKIDPELLKAPTVGWNSELNEVRVKAASTTVIFAMKVGLLYQI